MLALALASLTYISSLRFPFVFDDNPQIVENQQLRSWSSAPEFFTHHLWAHVAPESAGPFYRPAFLLWLLMNFQVFGLHPAGWHATTIAVHLVVTWLVFRLALRWTHDDWVAGATALLFALHPTHIETIAWISGVTDALMAVFFLAALLGYSRWHDGERPARNLALALSCGALAMLAKETAVVLPAIVAAHAWIYRQDQPARSRLRGAAVASAPFVLVAGAYLLLRATLRGINMMQSLPWTTMVLTWPGLLWSYVRHLVWPVGLSAFYETPYVTAPTAAFWRPLLAMAVVAVALWALLRRWRAPAAKLAIAFLVVPIVPALQLRAFQFAELAHDRYLYLSSIGFALLAAMLLGRPRTQPPMAGRSVAATCAVLALGALYAGADATQSVQWASTTLLYTRAVQIAPNNVHALEPLAQEMLRQGRLDEAIVLLERASGLVPTDWSTHFLLAHTCFTRHRFDEAEQHFRRAIEINPNSAAEHYFLGLTLLELDQTAEAEAPLRRAIALLPAGRGFHEALARVLLARGDVAGARAELQAELSNEPNNPSARAELERLR